MSEGVYVRSGDVVIHLNTASEAQGSGINLMPGAPIPEPDGGGRIALAITHAAFRRICEQLPG